jgi:hypothetical protein
MRGLGLFAIPADFAAEYGKDFCRPYIFGVPFDSTAIEAGSSVDEKLKGHGPEAVPF